MEKLTKEQFLEGQILLIDKPLTWSSFQAVNKIKYALIKNLDLPKNKRIAELQGQIKEYTGTITVGATTPSYDLETEINETFPTEHITKELIEKTRLQFIGEIDQYPPIFSAIKKDGKRLYEHARAGEEVEIKSRKIEITEFEITRVELPDIDFRVVCSKGTYIRSLAFDFGKALQSGGHLTALRRTKIGNFSVDDAMEPLAFEKIYNPNFKETE